MDRKNLLETNTHILDIFIYILLVNKFQTHQ